MNRTVRSSKIIKAMWTNELILVSEKQRISILVWEEVLEVISCNCLTLGRRMKPRDGC